MTLRKFTGRLLVCSMMVGIFATAAAAEATNDHQVQLVKEEKVDVTADLIVGSWLALSPEGHEVQMIFSADGIVKLMVDGRSREGVVTTYRFDPSSDPGLLDVTAKANGREHTMPGIVHFLTPNKMQVVMAEKRPADFSGDVLVFSRKK